VCNFVYNYLVMLGGGGRLQFSNHGERLRFDVTSPDSISTHKVGSEFIQNPGQLKLKLIYDRRSVGQSVLVSGTHLGPTTNFSFSLKFPLDSCGFSYFVAPSLTRRRVCNLQYNCFWALSEQSLLGRSPTELTTIFYCLI
jgi:hypothetical protein